jgi:2-methylcitrate synthase
MTFGKVPEPQIIVAFETSLILYAEHYTGACIDRVLAAASFDVYSAVAAAAGTLKDSPHGCASKAVMRMLNGQLNGKHITPGRIDWDNTAITSGIGHLAIWRTDDRT